MTSSPFAARSAKESSMPEAAAHPPRLGILTPSSNTVLEPLTAAMLRGPSGGHPEPGAMQSVPALTQN